jgi:uncharacterized protein YecT (DUF1311 family)
MTRFDRLNLTFFLAALAPAIAIADQPPSAMEIEARVDNALSAEVAAHCVDGNALERVFCFKDRLATFDKELDALIETALNQTKNVSGDVATEEQRQNIREAQAAWKSYRHEHCWFSYVEHQSFNISSRQLDNFVCEIRRTLRRMQEIRIDYIGDWQ